MLSRLVAWAVMTTTLAMAVLGSDPPVSDDPLVIPAATLSTSVPPIAIVTPSIADPLAKRVTVQTTIISTVSLSPAMSAGNVFTVTTIVTTTADHTLTKTVTIPVATVTTPVASSVAASSAETTFVKATHRSLVAVRAAGNKDVFTYSPECTVVEMTPTITATVTQTIVSTNFAGNILSLSLTPPQAPASSRPTTGFSVPPGSGIANTQTTTLSRICVSRFKRYYLADSRCSPPGFFRFGVSVSNIRLNASFGSVSPSPTPSSVAPLGPSVGTTQKASGSSPVGGIPSASSAAFTAPAAPTVVGGGIDNGSGSGSSISSSSLVSSIIASSGTPSAPPTGHTSSSVTNNPAGSRATVSSTPSAASSSPLSVRSSASVASPSMSTISGNIQFQVGDYHNIDDIDIFIFVIIHGIVKLNNIPYFLPKQCANDKRPAQRLWLPDGRRFSLDCKSINIAGTSFKLPNLDVKKPLEDDCSHSGDLDICFSKRFDLNETDIKRDGRWQVQDGDGHSREVQTIPQIAKALGYLSHDGCDLYNVMIGVGVDHFKFAMHLTEDKLFQDTAFINDFFRTTGDAAVPVLGFALGENKTRPWIDEVDLSFGDLLCYVEGDPKTGIGRALQKHEALHAGLNAIQSIRQVVETDLISLTIQSRLNAIAMDLRAEYVKFIGTWGQITQALTQTRRLCKTDWGEDKLRSPKKQPRDIEDEDEWLPRYWIQTKDGTSFTEMRALELALGQTVGGNPIDSPQGPWEMGAAINSPSFLVDLNKDQAEIARLAVGFIRTTGKIPLFQEEQQLQREAQKQGIYARRGVMRPRRKKEDDLTNKTRPIPDKRSNPYPFADPRPDENATPSRTKRSNPYLADPRPDVTTTARAHRGLPFHLKSLCAKKGQYVTDVNEYPHYSHEGEGAWIWILDRGFNIAPHADPTHGELRKNGRELRGYIPANHVLSPQFTPQEVAMGHGWEPETLEELWPWEQSHGVENFGHGTPIACLAGGVNLGIASKANLFLLKNTNIYREPIFDQYGHFTHHEYHAGLEHRLHFEHVFNYMEHVFATNNTIPPHKSVLLITQGKYPHLPSPMVFKDYPEQSQEESQAWGVTIVHAVGNDGFQNHSDGSCDAQYYMADWLPDKMTNESTPFIAVGGVYSDGSLWEGSTPSGSRYPGHPYQDARVSLYGVAVDVASCAARGNYGYYEGNSFSAPQVAGLAANMLTYPWPPGQNPFQFNDGLGLSTGMRMKKLLVNLAYQRLPYTNLTTHAWADPHSRVNTADPKVNNWPWPVPAIVNVVYNNARGPQRCVNLASMGLPAGLKRDNDHAPTSCPFYANPPGTPLRQTTVIFTGFSHLPTPSLSVTSSPASSSTRMPTNSPTTAPTRQTASGGAASSTPRPAPECPDQNGAKVREPVTGRMVTIICPYVTEMYYAPRPAGPGVAETSVLIYNECATFCATKVDGCHSFIFTNTTGTNCYTYPKAHYDFDKRPYKYQALGFIELPPGGTTTRTSPIPAPAPSPSPTPIPPKRDTGKLCPDLAGEVFYIQDTDRYFQVLCPEVLDYYEVYRPGGDGTIATHAQSYVDCMSRCRGAGMACKSFFYTPDHAESGHDDVANAQSSSLNCFTNQGHVHDNAMRPNNYSQWAAEMDVD
ncbi:hypothetical protein B0H63DRAFT_510616 [Podospora didyma]|uniref:Peptidase S8/S53 domain-containing protein n=1 Tax=Podospora didyma TaxID=330526 RepID=A0AAE0NQQ3_9PEZI|nr:hypothetical protein B0H63DRAFT_510616 [Podospora didyma]